MAEFLHVLAYQYDYPQLTEEVLKEVGVKEFNSTDTKGPKSISTFLIKISELTPDLVIKQINVLAKLLESEVGRFVNRCQASANDSTVLYLAYGSDRSVR